MRNMSWLQTEQDRELASEFIKHFSRDHILMSAKKNEEKPFGFVIDWIRDQGCPKSKGWAIAEALCRYYDIPI